MGVKLSNAALKALAEAGLSTQEIEALVAKKARNEFVETLVPTAEAFATAAFAAGVTVKPSSKETSTWVGASVQSVPVTVDGKSYMVSVTIKDVAASQEAATKAKANA